MVVCDDPGPLSTVMKRILATLQNSTDSSIGAFHSSRGKGYDFLVVRFLQPNWSSLYASKCIPPSHGRGSVLIKEVPKIKRPQFLIPRIHWWDNLILLPLIVAY